MAKKKNGIGKKLSFACGQRRDEIKMRLKLKTLKTAAKVEKEKNVLEVNENCWNSISFLPFFDANCFFILENGGWRGLRCN